MRITLGGVLLLGGAVAAGYYAGHTAPLTMVKSKAMDLTKHVGTLVGLYQAGDSPAPAEDVYSPPPPFPNGSVVGELGVAGSTDTVALGDAAIEASTETVAAAAAAVVATPAPTPVVKKKPVAKKRPATTAKKRVTKKRTTTAARKKPAPKKTAPAATKPANPADRLIGSYVSLELITGRAVQGILEAKTATHYKLNVPGLGPLDYPIENVRTVSPAQ